MKRLNVSSSLAPWSSVAALTLMVLGSQVTLPGQVFAADYLPLSEIDAKSDGGVIRAGSSSDAGRGGLTPKVSFTRVKREAQSTHASFLIGAGLGSRLDLSLGIHGVGEDKADEFSGASVFVKVKALDLKLTKISVAPFFQTGSGSDAIDSNIRSVGSKVGGLAAMSLGDEDSFALGLNAGIRYHDNEMAGKTTIRDENFYSARLGGAVTYNWTVFADSKARRVTSAATSLDETQSLSYNSVWAYGAGMGTTYSSYGKSVTLQYFKGTGGAETFGYGDRSFSLSFALDLGRSQRDGRRSLADGVNSRQTQDESKGMETLVLQDGAPEFLRGGEVNPTADVGKGAGDDFQDIEERQAKIQKEFSQESEDDRIERELKALKLAEEKLAKERDAIEAAELEADRIAKVKKAAKDAIANKKVLDEAATEARALPGATDDDLNWNGLED